MQKGCPWTSLVTASPGSGRTPRSAKVNKSSGRGTSCTEAQVKERGRAKGDGSRGRGDAAAGAGTHSVWRASWRAARRWQRRAAGGAVGGEGSARVGR